MPSRIFGIWSNPHPQLDVLATPKHKSSSTGSLDGRRQSMDHLKRPALNLVKKHSSFEKKSKSKERSLSKDKREKDGTRTLTASSPIKLGLHMESPPILMMDSPQQSSGSLISGRIQITPIASEVMLSSLTMYLECSTATLRPVADKCRDCTESVKDLYEWNFLRSAKMFKASQGMHEIPFSHLIPGHLPATTHGHIGSIDYRLHVRATTIDGQNIELKRELIIGRALRPGNDKNSVRVFPPTNLTLHVKLPNVVHPIGEFPVECRLTGITTKREDTQTRWRLRKLTWKIEEHEKAVSPACQKHMDRVGGEGKGLQHENTRQVGFEELKQGWKTDLSDGSIEGEFMAALDPSTKPQCGVESSNGLKVSHNLVLELVIAEEWAYNKRPELSTPSGAARVLRTQFALNVTERCGMGIAWDDEQPPMYEDVPASPPHYQNERTQVDEYEGDDLHEDVEHLSLGS